MEGQIFGSRYELIEKIGGGGMAVVYKAKCMLLNRYVAIKVLRQEFTNDEEFVKRFRVEAQSAASLSHPNIVPIYDVGNEGNIHYIVMEYVRGITLKEHIDNNGPLNWKEAIRIEIQICSAIEQAHQNHIIHRDIKPHNILLTKDGIAKVTDFGIARAVSSSTITMVGSTIGSVHYFSPEQARGGFVDEKSDLYSMGIVLYEMVTKSIPFDADTPVAVALKHIQIVPKEPIEINENLPIGVNNIIMKAIKKEQNTRYQKAQELLNDLRMVLNEPEGSFITNSISENIPTRRMKAISDDSLVSKEDSDLNDKGKKGQKNNDKMTYWLAGITAFILIAILLVIGYSVIYPSIFGQKASYIIDNYAGRNINEVESELAKKSIGVKKSYVFNENYDKDIIISNYPSEQSVKEGFTVTFTVSNGTEKFLIPDYANTNKLLAEKEIKNAGVKYKEVQEYSETVAKEAIIRTEPEAGTEVDIGSTISIIISMGVEKKITTVPNLIGKTQNEANALLREKRLYIGDIIPESGSYISEKITDQIPKAGTEVDEESTVDIYFNRSAVQIAVTKQYQISLTNPEGYGDTIKVYIEAIRSDKGVVSVLMDEDKLKSDFPLSISVTVPSNGSTTINVDLNGLPYKQNVTITPTD